MINATAFLKSISLHEFAWADTQASTVHTVTQWVEVSGKGLVYGVLVGFIELTLKGTRDRRPRTMEGVGLSTGEVGVE